MIGIGESRVALVNGHGPRIAHAGGSHLPRIGIDIEGPVDLQAGHRRAQYAVHTSGNGRRGPGRAPEPDLVDAAVPTQGTGNTGLGATYPKLGKSERAREGGQRSYGDSVEEYLQGIPLTGDGEVMAVLFQIGRNRRDQDGLQGTDPLVIFPEERQLTTGDQADHQYGGRSTV